MIKKKTFAFCMVGVLVLILVGCSGSQSPSPASASAAASSSAVSAAPLASSSSLSAPASNYTVNMVNRKFTPTDITINKGETVTWINTDSVAHNVVGDKFKSGTLENGQSFSYTFNETGTFYYSCTFHPGMNGTVTVK